MRISISLFLLFLTVNLSAQNFPYQSSSTDDRLPAWAQMMYGANVNALELRDAYEAYYKEHEFEKTIHTQNYKRFIAQNRSFIQGDGSIQKPNLRNEDFQTSAERGNDIWYFEGPNHHVVSDGTLTEGFRHSNVYCHDRSSLNTDLLFCGTESGGVYKTLDAGLNWSFVTKEYPIGGVQSVRIKPSDDNVVICSGADELWRTENGGLSWEIIGQPSFVNQNIRAWEILFHPENNDIVFAATNRGLFRSADGGDNWDEILNNNCEAVRIQPGNPQVVYAIHYESDLGYSKFYKSTDYGVSFEVSDEGWFDQSMGDIQIDGGRLAVTEADPNRIYALLVGYENAGSEVVTNGWVGTWVSYDAGETWELPHELIGMPYTDEHPNLMNFQSGDGTYTQIHYNTTMAASQLDADKVLIGGLNLWVSNDACATYEGVGGYIGGIDYFHVDQQELRIYKTSETTEDIWLSNDGGILYSNDFMESHTNLNRGIQAVNLWGYDQGWNEDIMVGGRYHNGNMAYHENYEDGEFLALGGGEAPTGYVNYNDENETFFSDINGKRLPEVYDGIPENINLSLDPNESYWNNGSSRILFDHSYFDTAWLGRDNKIYKSIDGGSSYTEIHAFGTNADHKVLWIEQSYVNHDVFYLHQAQGNSSAMWKSTDHGESWTGVNLPSTLRNMNFTTSSSSENELWVSYYDGNNGFKVFHTNDGGANWTNLSTETLDNLSPWAMAHQFGTNGGVYLAMRNGEVFYRNAEMNDWSQYSSGLPVSTEPLRIVPFYKEGVVRLATWNLGVWEAPLFEESGLLVDFSAAKGTYFCTGESIHFVDHSVVPAGATYEWSFPGGQPSTSTEKYPDVFYQGDGPFDVSLSVTFNGETISKTKSAYISGEEPLTVFPLEENWEGSAFDEKWHLTEGTRWEVNSDASAFGQGTYSVRYDNYYFDAQGVPDAFTSGKILAEGFEGDYLYLSFDYAYARYNSDLFDTLRVKASYDCGESWEVLWEKGGLELATAPDIQGYFVPSDEEWVNDMATGDYSMDGVLLAFENIGHYGNPIYIDNINIEVFDDVVEKEGSFNHFKISPNPSSGVFTLNGIQLHGSQYGFQLCDAMGRSIEVGTLRSNSGVLRQTFDWSFLASGLYYLRLNDDKGQSQVLQLVKN